MQKRFGSIKEALEYKNQKKAELESYMNISFQKQDLKKEYFTLEIEIKDLAKKKITGFRKENLGFIGRKNKLLFKIFCI